jgi:hypothetical protein
MKYVFLTNANSEGVSEVFHTVLLPEDLVPEDMVDRWNTLVSSSPIVGRVLHNKENVAIGSTWNEDSQTLSLAKKTTANKIMSTENHTYGFFVNNVMLAGMNSNTNDEMSIAKFKAAFSEPITVVKVSDDDEVENGYTYNGSVFTPPDNF